jgi:hypothetical protein
MIKSVRRHATEVWVNIQVENIEDLDVEALTGGTELCFLVATEVKDWEMVGLMFGPMEEGDLLIMLEPEVWTWPKLLAHLKCFPSASQAAKNLKAQHRTLDFEKGFTDFYIGKARKIRVSLWNPYMPEKI